MYAYSMGGGGGVDDVAPGAGGVSVFGGAAMVVKFEDWARIELKLGRKSLTEDHDSSAFTSRANRGETWITRQSAVRSADRLSISTSMIGKIG